MARIPRESKTEVTQKPKDAKAIPRITSKEAFIFMYEVKSTNVAFIGHHDNTMYVVYKNDSMYRFNLITKQQFYDIKTSDSIGKAINALGVKGTLV